MPSPFPGFDPYIESQLNWLDFHTTFLVYISQALMGNLPPGFVAELEVYVSVVQETNRASGEPRTEAREGDVTVFRADTAPLQGAWRGNIKGISTPETVSARPQKFLKVIDARGAKPVVVAVIELLSPSNKNNGGFLKYERKQAQLLECEIHFMEIDLLRAGRHTVFVEESAVAMCGGYDYLVCLRDLFVPELSAFWRIGLQEPLPTVYLPLTSDVPPVPFDLQGTFTQYYDANFVARRVDYTKPLAVPPFTDSDVAWASDLFRSAG